MASLLVKSREPAVFRTGNPCVQVIFCNCCGDYYVAEPQLALRDEADRALWICPTCGCPSESRETIG